MSLSTLADHYCPSIFRPILNRVQQSPIGKRIVSGTFWSVIGNSFGKVFTFIAMVLVARILGSQLYGELGLIQSIAGVFIGLSGFGLGTAATKYIAELVSHDKQRVGRIIGLCYIFTFITCFLAALFMFGFAPLICNSTILKAPHLVNELRISVFMLIFITFMGTQIGVMSGFQDFRGLAYASFITGLISLPIYVLCAYYGGLYGAIIGIGIGALTNVIINSVFIYRNVQKYYIHYDFHNALKEIPIVWKLSLPTFLCGITFCIFTAIYRFMLVASPDGFHELGIYIAATQIETIVYFIPVQISGVLLPLLSNTRGRGNIEKSKYISNFGIILTMSTTLILVIPILLMPGYIMSFFGNDFIEGASVLLLICIGLVFHAGMYALYMEYISQNRAIVFFILTYLFHLVQLILLYYFILLNYGACGMALSYSLAHILYFFSVLLFRK